MRGSKTKVLVFISHSSKDTELASLIVEAIKARLDIQDQGIRCSSLPGYKLGGGMNVASTLQEEIRGALAVVGILTPNSLSSPWPLFELGAAWGLVQRFVPVVAGLDADEVKGPLGAAHVWRLENVEDVKEALREISSHLRKAVPFRSGTEELQARTIESLAKFVQMYQPDIEVTPVCDLFALHLPSREIRADSVVFQDFGISRRHNNTNPVHFMWADAFTNGSIRSSVIAEPGKNFLRVWFENGTRREDQGELAKGWASNIKIRPQDETALGNGERDGDLKHRFLDFQARIPEQEADDGWLREIGLTVRLLDRRLTYWSYSDAKTGGQPSQFRVVIGDWQRFRIDMREGGFSVFGAEGNQWCLKRTRKDRFPIPDFTVLAGATFVLGSFTAGREEPGIGRGVLDIKDIRLGD